MWCVCASLQNQESNSRYSQACSSVQRIWNPPLNHNQWASPTHTHSPKEMGSFFIYWCRSKNSPTVSRRCTQFVKKTFCSVTFILRSINRKTFCTSEVQRLTTMCLMVNGPDGPAYFIEALITLFKTLLRIQLAGLNRDKKKQFLLQNQPIRLCFRPVAKE